MNEVKTSIQDLDEKFNKEIEILGKTEIMKVKNAINQVKKKTMRSVTKRLDLVKERISDTEDKLKNYYIQTAIKK
jgi:polyhydroxyalkanoate synthesis regulator phasin